jgi:hypothetical protein
MFLIPPKHHAYSGSALETVDLNAEPAFQITAEKHCRVAQTPLYVRPLLAGRAIAPLKQCQFLTLKH